MAGQGDGNELRATTTARAARPAQSLTNKSLTHKPLTHNLVLVVCANANQPNWKATLDQRLREAMAGYSSCRIINVTDHIKADGLVLRRAFCRARQ